MGVLYCIQIVLQEFIFQKAATEKGKITLQVKIVRLTVTSQHKRCKPEDNIRI